MREVVKQKWVEALRSGKYKQGRSVLRSESGFCCLGVLCDIYHKTRKIQGTNWEGDGINGYEHLGETAFPDPAVVKWAGMSCKNPELPVDMKGKKTSDETNSLSSLNDAGVSFAKIATLIEKHL